VASGLPPPEFLRTKAHSHFISYNGKGSSRARPGSYTTHTRSPIRSSYNAHHQCWRLIHGELARLAAPEWKFLCISGEKCLQTLWNEIPSEIEGLHYLNLTQDALWTAARDREMGRPLTQAEISRVQEGQPKEDIAKERFWRMRPDGIAVLPPGGKSCKIKKAEGRATPALFKSTFLMCP